ncbi:MAG: hypothetical protein ABJN69_07990 [Hellea sp.]
MKLVVKFYSAEENGRSVLPEFDGGQYRPHLVIDDDPNKEYLGVQFIRCDDVIAFNTDIKVDVKLPYRNVDYAGLLPGVSFVIKEGSKSVGSGNVQAL